MCQGGLISPAAVQVLWMVTLHVSRCLCVTGQSKQHTRITQSELSTRIQRRDRHRIAEYKRSCGATEQPSRPSQRPSHGRGDGAGRRTRRRWGGMRVERTGETQREAFRSSQPSTVTSSPTSACHARTHEHEHVGRTHAMYQASLPLCCWCQCAGDEGTLGQADPVVTVCWCRGDSLRW